MNLAQLFADGATLFVPVPLEEKNDRDTHATLAEGKLVCTSQIHKLADGVWRLASIETTAAVRSRGYGSTHMESLIAHIKETDPNARVLFFEISSRKIDELKLRQNGSVVEHIVFSDEDKENRHRRFAFYDFLGAHLWDGTGETQPDNPLHMMEMMWFSLSDTPVSQDDIALELNFLHTNHAEWFKHPSADMSF